MASTVRFLHMARLEALDSDWQPSSYEIVIGHGFKVVQ